MGSSMRLPADRKWEIFREFYEHRNVSLAIIAELNGVAPAFLSNKISKENWIRRCTARQLRQRLAWAINDYFELLESDDPAFGQNDKMASSLQVIAKALDTLSLAEARAGTSDDNENLLEQGRDRKTRLNDDTAITEERVQNLNRDLQKLVADIEQDRRSVTGR